MLPPMPFGGKRERIGMTQLKAKYDEQSAVWNGVAGHAWAQEQDLINEAFKPMEDRLVEELWTVGAAKVLDVGCGTGATTLALSKMGHGAVECVGIDISQEMIAAARARAAARQSTAQFVCADAQAHAFAATFDMIVSRFGVMFFDEPGSAFLNLRRACRDAAQMRLLVFRTASENPFMTTAERAAAPLFPAVPVRVDGPGQFAFADTARVRAILEAGGWTGVEFQPIDFECSFPSGKLQTFFTRLGPLGRILHEADADTRTRIVTSVRAAFEPYVDGDRVRFEAACWMVSARAGIQSGML
ncbi:class I SAM-dependent methyltransferase [Sphingobium sp. B2D3C]|uniref:class I SAM-dependent methyltransferase n=1 Tax=Sphingobium sp. B2D3C TaxID=2940581 RepID=UPI002225A0E3|nr:class I SAM-dependent methyltransferase [Sphingobium sp. B2D3C]MCW2397929.1 ubiquinone/menaquinone biosynthesis C-methylase UbiE [Sphingobium sp. B2D3C]